ncbi:MAG: DUF5719 family protein, partial [Candidatus Dormibacteraceae bacterium]
TPTPTPTPPPTPTPTPTPTPSPTPPAPPDPPSHATPACPASNSTTQFPTSPLGGRPYTGGSDAAGTPAPATHAYFAEGYTGADFQEYLAVENPGPAQTLAVQYFFASGAPIVKSYQLPATSRTTIDVNADVGAGQSVSAYLCGQLPFLAERPMYFNYQGRVTGGDTAVGSSSLATTFYFAEGMTGPGFDEYLTYLNPNDQPTAITTTYYFQQGAPVVVDRTVAPQSRFTVHVNDPSEAGPGKEVSATVTSSRPILVERPMYFDYQGRTGGDVAMGARSPSDHLNLAEGHVGQGFDEYLALFNPGSQDAHASITYYLSSGGQVVTQLAVPAHARRTVHVNDVLLPGSDDAVHVDSDQPIVVERPMYFSYGPGWTGGHDGVAVDDSGLGTAFFLAEGYVAPNFDEYLAILNRNPAPSTVTITFLLPDGSVRTVVRTVAARSRYTELVDSDLPPGTSSSIEVTSTLPIMIERPMYFAY